MFRGVAVGDLAATRRRNRFPTSPATKRTGQETGKFPAYKSQKPLTWRSIWAEVMVPQARSESGLNPATACSRDTQVGKSAANVMLSILLKRRGTF